MSPRPLCPAWPPPRLSLTGPGAMSSSSCTTRISSGWSLKKRASEATDWPEWFMKVCGCNSQTLWPCTVVRASRAWWLRSGSSVVLSSRASASIHQKPALWRGGAEACPRVAQAGKQLDHLRNGRVGLGPGTWQRPAGAVAMWPEGAVGRAPRALDYFLALGFAAGLAAAAGLAVAAGLAALPLPLASATGAGGASATVASGITTGGATATRAGLC